MFSYLRLALSAGVLIALAGCGPDYSPNSYSAAAVQQANKVYQGVVAGFREVAIKADGTVGAVTGGAAGGVLGAQAPEGGVITALSAIGGTLIGGLVGNTVEHAAGDTTAFEYIVRKANGDLVSVTQKDTAPLAIGLKVLVIEGKQARIVPDYSVDLQTPSATASTGKPENKAEPKSSDTTQKNADAPPAPVQAPQPAIVDTQPTPANDEGDHAPASEPMAAEEAPPPNSAPRAEAPPVPLAPPSPPNPPSAQIDEDIFIPLALPSDAPADSDSHPTP